MNKIKLKLYLKYLLNIITLVQSIFTNLANNNESNV